MMKVKVRELARKALAVFLSFAMVSGTVPAQALAEALEPVGDEGVTLVEEEATEEAEEEGSATTGESAIPDSSEEAQSAEGEQPQDNGPPAEAAEEQEQPSMPTFDQEVELITSDEKDEHKDELPLMSKALTRVASRERKRRCLSNRNSWRTRT